MPAFIFNQMDMAAGAYGSLKMIPTAVEQEEAGKNNKRANERVIIFISRRMKIYPDFQRISRSSICSDMLD